MTEADKIKILVVDDHEIVRIGLKLVLLSWPEVEVVGEAANGVDAQILAKELNPDVILMDIHMPTVDGITAAKNIREEHEKIRIIILSSHSDVSSIRLALDSGVNGYCLKDVDDERLKRAILSVLDGDLWLDARVSGDLLTYSKDSDVLSLDLKEDSISSDSSLLRKFPFEPLSERELAVLELLVDGLTNKEIGDRLYISRDTVKTHIKHIMEKLVAKGRTDAAVKAVRGKLV